MLKVGDYYYWFGENRNPDNMFRAVSVVGNFWNDAHREAPAMFIRGGVYFMLTSAATGWNPNQARYATAPSVSGPWTGWTDVGDGTTFNSQSGGSRTPAAATTGW